MKRTTEEEERRKEELHSSFILLCRALCGALFRAWCQSAVSKQQTTTTTSTTATTSSSNKAQMTPNRGSAIKGIKNADRHADREGAVVLDHQPARPLCLVSCRSGSVAFVARMPTRARLTTRTKPAIAHLPRTTMPRETPLSSAAKLRAPPRLPHSTGKRGFRILFWTKRILSCAVESNVFFRLGCAE